MKILYSGVLTPGGSCFYRLTALARLGHSVIPFDMVSYRPRSPLSHYISHRLSLGNHISRYNTALLEVARCEKPNIFWGDKDLLVWPETLRQLRRMGVRTVSFMNDDAFGPRKDHGWRLYKRNLRIYDLHVTPRKVCVCEYRQLGAQHVIEMPFSYEPSVHYPSAVPLSDGDRDRGISFIGSPYDDRAGMLAALSNSGLPIVVSGSSRPWLKALGQSAFKKLFRHGELYGAEYREAIWKSKVSLSFITHSNRDEMAHKSFEIAACGGFLVAERSDGHRATFVEDREAVLFSTFDELRAKLTYYLAHEKRRDEVAAAGRRRAVSSEYDNDSRLRHVLSYLARF